MACFYSAPLAWDPTGVDTSHSLHRFIRFQLIQASALLVAGEEAKALGQKRYDAFLDSLARMIAGGERSVSPADDEPQGSKP
jgi:hypothetical protein